jgi:hypothetical protein
MKHLFSRLLVVTMALTCAMAPTVAFAGSPHFISVSASRSGNTLTVTFKEAGLGSEPTVNIGATATALCINGGSNHPKASNKQDLAPPSSTFDVNNGQATGSVTVTATLSCDPPMTLEFTNVVIHDYNNNIQKSLSGTF